jgi:hypothetical protein
MATFCRTALVAGPLAILADTTALAVGMSDEEVIKNATSAAPTGVAANATVITFDERMQMKTLKDGENGFTCIPDDPRTPTDDPMCVDANGLAFVQAWIARKAPPAGKVGFGYMLKGGSSPSNTDPFATAPAAGENWAA